MQNNAPFQPYTIDASVTRIGGGSICVPEGVYLLQIQGAEGRVNDKGEAGSRWQFLIVESTTGDGLGQVYSEGRNTFGADKQFGTGQIIVAAGADPASILGKQIASEAEHKAFIAALGTALQGRKVGVVMSDHVYNGQTSSQVSQWFSEAEYRSRAALLAAAPPKPAAPAAPVANGAAGAVAPLPSTEAVAATLFPNL